MSGRFFRRICPLVFGAAMLGGCGQDLSEPGRRAAEVSSCTFCPMTFSHPPNLPVVQVSNNRICAKQHFQHMPVCSSHTHQHQPRSRDLLALRSPPWMFSQPISGHA